MDPTFIGSIVVVVMVTMLLLRTPIAIALVAAGFGGMTWVLISRAGGFNLENVYHALAGASSFLGLLPFSSVAEYTFSTIPLFILMGYFATEAGFTTDIYNATRMWLARVPGGLAVASAVGCAIFAAISGSSLATAAAMGKMALPEMLNWKYDKGLAAGVVAAGGTLGALIPPSILMILYAVFTEQSIAQMFIAGVIPGLISIAMFVIMIAIRCKINPELAPLVPDVPLREKFESLRGIWGIIALLLIIIVGLYMGLFTPNEAAGIGAAVCFLLGLVSRRLNKKAVNSALAQTIETTSMLFAAVMGAYMVSAFVGLTGIASDLTLWAASIENVHPLVIMASLSLLYIFLGTFMGSIEIMLLTLPVVIPIIEGFGYNLIWFGIIMIKYLEIGLITPPVGLNVFVIKAVAGDTVSTGEIFKGVTWFILADVVTLTILILFPAVTLVLPNMMLGT